MEVFGGIVQRVRACMSFWRRAWPTVPSRSLGAVLVVALVAGLLQTLPGIAPPASAVGPAPTSTTLAPNGDVTTTGWTKVGAACTGASFFTCVNDYSTDTTGTSYDRGPYS